MGNAGPAIGDSEERLRELFGAYGQVVAVIFPEGRSHAFVSFASEDQAAAALEAAQGPLARAVGRRLVVKPAGTKQEKVCCQRMSDCCRSSWARFLRDTALSDRKSNGSIRNLKGLELGHKAFRHSSTQFDTPSR